MMQNISWSNLTAAVDSLQQQTLDAQKTANVIQETQLDAAIVLPLLLALWQCYTERKRAQSDVSIMGLAGSFEMLCNSWTTTHTHMTEETMKQKRESSALYAQMQGEANAKYSQFQGEANARYSQLQGEANATFEGMRAEIRRSFALQQAAVIDSIRAQMDSGWLEFLDHLLWPPYDGYHELRIPEQYFKTTGAPKLPPSFVPDMRHFVAALRPDDCDDPRSIQHVYRTAVTAFALWLIRVSDTYIARDLLAWSDLPFLREWLRVRFGWRAEERFDCEHPAAPILAHLATLYDQDDGSSQCSLLIALGVITRTHVEEAREFAMRLWPADEEE